MKKRLYNYCLELRGILNNCIVNYPQLFDKFPNAYCADASLWLCDYLISKGFERSDFEFRSRDPFVEGSGNHVWLNYKGIDIDITADQFNTEGYNFPQVIVTDNNNYYFIFDENRSKKEYSAHSYYPLCFIDDHWDEKYDIIYNLMGIEFDLSSVSISM